MGYNDKYPDMSAMYSIMFEAEDKLKNKIKELEAELERTRKENEDKQAVLNCVVDMLKTLNQRYTLIMGKDVIKETVRLLEQKDVK